MLRGRQLRWFVAIGLSVAVALFQFAAAGAETVQARATVSREAYFTFPITQTAPPLIRNGFPPATACLVAGLVGVPQICGTEAQQLAALAGLTDGLPVPVTPDGDFSQATVLPGTTPVGMAGGQTRYVSLAALNLPPLDTGQRYGKFELVLFEDGVNFSIESPALRDVVLQLISQASDQDPALIAGAIQRALTGEVPLAAETITGIEACPIVEEWNAGRGQGASVDGSRLPKVDCVAGTSGVFDEANRTWTFDLTFAVQAWTEGVDGEALPNQGIMLRPVGAPNLAYGDPDFSTNWQVSLADSTNADTNLRPLVRYETVVDDSELVVDPGGSVDFTEDGLDDAGGDLGGFDDGSVGGGLGTGTGTDAGGSGDGGGATIDVPKPRVVSSSGKGSTPGWLWFLLPLALIAAYVFEQSLIATPAALRRRAGALSALEANRAAEESGAI